LFLTCTGKKQRGRSWAARSRPAKKEKDRSLLGQEKKSKNERNGRRQKRLGISGEDSATLPKSVKKKKGFCKNF